MKEGNFEKLVENRYFGPEYEFDLLGEIKTEDSAYKKELAMLQEKAKARGYQPKQANSLPFREAVELTKKFQPGDPTNPQKDFAREMRLALAERLGLESDAEMNRLKFYTSVGGPLDAHGIDGFFVFSYVDKEGRTKECAVSFDVTKNPNKDEAAKADLLIGGDVPDPSDADFSEDEYLKKIEEYAKRGSAIFQEKMQRGETGLGGYLH
ncbi:MAG TPA: hypothetical protein P5089_02220 [Candidatus Portnoybacteria bacterium]|nr:hypothetical protein [Candidatus Portnoybacteria bacterium]